METILLLRELDVSVKEIQHFMKNRSADSLKILLEEKIKDLDSQITHLHAVRTTLQAHHQNMTTLLTMDLSEITVIEKKKRRLVTVDIGKDTSFEETVERITAETEKHHLGRLHHASYGSMIPVSSLEKGDYDDYTKLFIELPNLTENAHFHTAPEGNYLRAFHKGDWDHIPMRYRELFAFAKKHHLTLCGYSYEMGINENVIDRIEDYIVQIEIPILTP